MSDQIARPRTDAVPHLIALRPFDPADVETLQRIERSAHQRYASLGGFEAIVAAPATRAERFADGVTMVAEIDRRPCGYVIVKPLDGLGYIASLMVEEGLSGKGIGRTLLSWAEGYARTLGLAGACLATFREPRWNAPWYQRLGYRDMPDAEIGPGLRAILDRHATFLDMSTRVTLWKPL